MSSTAEDDAAVRTVSDLDAMDDKLRRLGLDVDHSAGGGGGVTALGNPSQSNSSDYIHSIRAAKAEKRQARLDRLARQASAAEKQQNSSTVAAAAAAAAALSTAAAARNGGAGAAAAHAEHTAVTDKALLASDTAEAAARAGQKSRADRAHGLRAERTMKAAVAHRQSRHEPQQLETALSRAMSASVEPIAHVGAAPERRVRKQHELVAWCAGVAGGLAELAMEVSDNRHLPVTGLAGRPVYRLQQDLPVTQWREWVDTLVFPASLHAAAAAAAAGDAVDEAAILEQAELSATRSADILQHTLEQRADASLQLEAARCITVAAEAETHEAARAQGEAVTVVLARLHAEVTRQRKAAEESVRRAADEASLAAADMAVNEASIGSGSAAVLPSYTPCYREELLPGWAQRMPPAACFVYGDDLSGARLLADTVDLCVYRKLMQQQQQQQPQTGSPQSPHRRSGASRRLSTSWNDGTDGTSGDTVYAAVAVSAVLSPADEHLSSFTVSDIGVEAGDVASAEGGVVATYVTPRTLMGTGAMSAAAGDTRRSGSAGRPQRGQQHASTSGGGGGTNALGLGGGVGVLQGGGGAALSPGTSAGASSRFSQRVSGASPDGRREHEQQLVEVVVREVVRVHRYNLGVLAGERMPSWVPRPAPPPGAAATGSVAAEDDGGEINLAALSSMPLRTLLLVGFPDTVAFTETFARRLRQATAAAEAEMMEAEGRRRAAEQQAAVAAAAAAESSKQRSPAPAKGPKGVSAAPTRAKGSRLAKAVPGAEESAAAAITESLTATLALPPLGVLATFLVYDLPTRQRRLEAASFAADVVAQRSAAGGGGGGGGGAGDDGEDEFGTFSLVVGSAMRAAGGPEYMHPVYHPAARDLHGGVAGVAAAAAAKEVAVVRAASVRPAGGNAVGSPYAGAAPTSPPSAAGVSTTAGATATAAAAAAAALLCVNTWDVERLRTELKQQHAMQHRQRKDWAAAVVVHGQGGSGENAAGSARNAAVSLRQAAKRRDKPAVSMSGIFSAPGAEAERSTLATSRRASVSMAASRAGDNASTAPGTAANGGSGTGKAAAAAEDVLLPRALFFSRVQDISDHGAPSNAAAAATAPPPPPPGPGDIAAATTSLGSAIWRAASSVRLQDGGTVQHHAQAEARARTVDQLTSQLRFTCRPATGRVLTNESLAPRQLAEPFRLSDYRFGEAACARLRRTSEGFSGTLPTAPLWGPLDKDHPMFGEEVTTAVTDALMAEAEVWAGVLQYAERLHQLVAEEVFRDRGSRPHHPDGSHSGSTFSTTAHFTGIDQSYARAKEAMAAYTAHAIRRVEECLALLVRLSVDVCLAQLAASVRLLCVSITRHHRSEVGVLFDASASMSVGDDLEEGFLAVAPRLPAEAAQALVGALACEEAKDASATLTSRLEQAYWPQVAAVAVSVATQHLLSCGLNNLAGTSPAAGTDAPLQLQPSQVSEGDAAASTAEILVADHLPGSVEVLLRHAVQQPAPLARVALVIHEARRMACAARDGAAAWVEMLYRDALSTRPASASAAACPASPAPRARRPRSLDELADGPFAVLHLGSEAAAAAAAGTSASGSAFTAAMVPAASRPSPWRCGQLEVLLGALRPASVEPEPAAVAGAMANIESFRRGLLVQQLQRVWRGLPDAAAALAAKAGYPMTDAAGAGGVRGSTRPASYAAAMARAMALPDTAPDAYLLHSCPCRLGAETQLPFLTTGDVEQLCAAALAEDSSLATSSVAGAGGAGAAAVTAVDAPNTMGNVVTIVLAPCAHPAPAATPPSPPLVDVELWLTNLVLRRCCFCGQCSLSAYESMTLEQPDVDEERTGLADQCPLLPVPERSRTGAGVPSSGTARHTIGSLPSAVLAQYPLVCTTAPPPPLPLVTTSRPAPGEMPAEWPLVQWWWRAWSAPDTASQGEDLQRCWALWRVLLAEVPQSPPPQQQASCSPTGAVTTAKAPLLVSLVRLLVGAGRRAGAAEERLRRAFHCLAALRRARDVPMGADEADVDADAAMYIEDTMVLTRDECAALGRLLSPPIRTAGAALADRSAGVPDFITDVQLLLQVEGTKGVTLPLLLSSRWASLLMREHF